MSTEKNGPYTPEGEYNMTGPDGLRLIFQGSFERDEIMRQMNAAHIAGVIAEATRSKWVKVSETSQPERNSTAIYYSRGGYIAIADEWRWEDHGERASHYLPFTPPQP